MLEKLKNKKVILAIVGIVLALVGAALKGELDVGQAVSQGVDEVGEVLKDKPADSELK